MQSQEDDDKARLQCVKDILEDSFNKLKASFDVNPANFGSLPAWKVEVETMLNKHWNLIDHSLEEMRRPGVEGDFPQEGQRARRSKSLDVRVPDPRI